ncbi:TraR/DksA C4-type zinc finger protein [Proteinivorax hydrogeniformans]|uniref:TraR/DksA C4-type zinc finger protein n=1 Tax=Proteinivorax hydrogeniformans TaxID=1826727 RepID=A0AAU8HPG9_9FIRM
MKEQEKKHLKEKLLKMKKELERSYLQENGSLRDQTQDLSTYDNHPGELASELYEKEKDLALKDNSDAEIKKIDDALKKIDSDQYGLCDSCGSEIENQRLEAIPYTTICAQCGKASSQKHLDSSQY